MEAFSPFFRPLPSQGSLRPNIFSGGNNSQPPGWKSQMKKTTNTFKLLYFSIIELILFPAYFLISTIVL
jgi:hypothetical protein